MASKLTPESRESVLCMLDVGRFPLPRVECGGVDEVLEPGMCPCQDNGSRVVKKVEDQEENVVWKVQDSPLFLWSAPSPSAWFLSPSPSPRGLYGGQPSPEQRFEMIHGEGQDKLLMGCHENEGEGLLENLIFKYGLRIKIKAELWEVIRMFGHLSRIHESEKSKRIFVDKLKWMTVDLQHPVSFEKENKHDS